ncbi:uncharacterized protein FA14DRAFT_176992 [Meira miltonrushii]|uniref:CENP-T/Histone H4 histone fold domain-containing protein n=1 Tax=Meira miltonrushii TaxID=1280837 RepID=A0A316VJ52_9BASI|nr:uncharacterized protein FA14DRAFT_176992 [Meira miltonrushii]PWN37707.1 hypothetical protein FA14DRAFT_176992 [Meira miltonrushii]
MSSGSGSAPEEVDEWRDAAVDSPISAADMLSKAAKQKRRQTTGRSSGNHFARPSGEFTPTKSTKRLFPDTPEVRKLGLTPSSRNHSQRKLKKAKNSQADKEDDDAGIDDTTDAYRDRSNVPVASTPYAAQRKQPISNRASIVSEKGGPSRRGSAGSVLRNSQMQEPSSSQFFHSSSSGQKRDKPGWLAGWGTGREESPMDILRRFAAAPGSLLSTPSSVLEQIRGDKQSETRQMNDLPASDGRQQPAESSSMGPTPSNSSRRQRPSTNLQQRHSMANTSAAISELGQGRRLDPRQSRLSTNLFANFGSPDSDFNDNTIPGKSFATHLPDFEDRESELQRILAERIAAEGFALPHPSNRTRQSLNMFNDLLQEEDESSAFGDKTATPAPNDFDQGGMQYEDIPDEEEEIPLPRQQGSESVANDDPESEREEELPMRIPRGGYEELSDLASDSDSRESLSSSNEEDNGTASSNQADNDISETYGKSRGKSKAVNRSSLLKKRSVRTKKKVRISRLTNGPVKSIPSNLVKKLFRKMVMPNVSVGIIPGPSRPNSRVKHKKVALDKEVLEAVEDITHEFFESLADTLSEYNDDSSRVITAKDMVYFMKDQGILDSQTNLVSLARKMLPRELSDQLAPGLDKEADEDADGGKYGMGNISAAVFNQEDFSSSVSSFSRSGSEEPESGIELLAYRQATAQGENSDSSSLLSQE